MPIVTPGAYTLAALTSELNTDPLGIGYATPLAAGQWQGAADKLNTNPEPITPANQESIYKRVTLAADMIAGIVLADYVALTAANRELCALVFGTEYVRTGDPTLRTLLSAIFPTSATRTNLINAASRLASRAEALWGEGTQISAEQVANARGQF
jgi:hypothetical protein